jgi:hypothetical protein
MIRPTLAMLCLFALMAGQARADSISIASSSPTVKVGQTVTLTVSINTTDPSPPAGTDNLNFAESFLAQTGVPFANVGNFRLAPGVLQGSVVQKETGPPAPAAGSASVIFPFPSNAPGNGLSSFDGPIYEFDFTPTSRGTYTFAFPDPSTQADFVVYNSPGGRVFLTGDSTATIVAFGATAVPEPAGLTLVGVCLGGFALRAWRKRRAV